MGAHEEQLIDVVGRLLQYAEKNIAYSSVGRLLSEYVNTTVALDEIDAGTQPEEFGAHVQCLRELCNQINGVPFFQLLGEGHALYDMVFELFALSEDIVQSQGAQFLPEGRAPLGILKSVQAGEASSLDLGKNEYPEP